MEGRVVGFSGRGSELVVRPLRVYACGLAHWFNGLWFLGSMVSSFGILGWLRRSSRVRQMHLIRLSVSGQAARSHGFGSDREQPPCV
jgi:hypothetical protein